MFYLVLALLKRMDERDERYAKILEDIGKTLEVIKERVK